MLTGPLTLTQSPQAEKVGVPLLGALLVTLPESLSQPLGYAWPPSAARALFLREPGQRAEPGPRATSKSQQSR